MYVIVYMDIERKIAPTYALIQESGDWAPSTEGWAGVTTLNTTGHMTELVSLYRGRVKVYETEDGIRCHYTSQHNKHRATGFCIKQTKKVALCFIQRAGLLFCQSSK